MSAGLSTPLPLLFSFGSSAVPAAASVYSPFAFWVGGAGSLLKILPGASFEHTVCILSSTSETVDVMTSAESTVCIGPSFDSTVCIADLSG